MELATVMDKMAFRIACIRKGVTGPQVARALGVAVSTIWSWANGYWNPSAQHRKALAEFLAVPEAELFTIKTEARDPGVGGDISFQPGRTS